MIRRAVWFAIIVLMLDVVPFGPARAASNWNDAAIAWRPYSRAVVEARASHKPICLVFYTNWCPQCRSYARVFHAPEVVAAARQFVMVRVDADVATHLRRKLAFDGTYIPRTYFLSSDGVAEPRVHAARDDYKYFYDPDDPASLLDGMEQAQRMLH